MGDARDDGRRLPAIWIVRRPLAVDDRTHRAVVMGRVERTHAHSTFPPCPSFCSIIGIAGRKYGTYMYLIRYYAPYSYILCGNGSQCAR